MLRRVAGILLFLPVPIVLLLFTRFPLGVPWSLAVGIAIMATHRLYARPFARRHAASRCLWCGVRVDAARSARVVIREPFGITEWSACQETHADRLRRALHFARRHTGLLKLGILGGLALFLPGALASHYGGLGRVRPEDCVAFFRISVAAAVLPMGWLATRSLPSKEDPLPAPFPVHIQALIGTAAVLWLFRLVGIAWLALGLVHVCVG
jgi:hypothetical protein